MKSILAWSGFLLLLASHATADPFTVAGIWAGKYDCAQGNTALELDISVTDPKHLQALFYFHAAPNNPYVPSGCFLMVGRFDDAANHLTLTPTKWLLQPMGYVWVAIDGMLGPDGNLTGSIAGPGCSDFSLTRTANTGQAPAPCKSSDEMDVS